MSSALGSTKVNGPSGLLIAKANATGEATVDATARQLTAWNTNGSFDRMTVDHTDNSIATTIAGDYVATAAISFSGTINATYLLSIRKYDLSATAWLDQDCQVERKLGTGGDVGACSIEWRGFLDVGDKVGVFQSTADGSALTMTNGQLLVNSA